MSLEEINYLRFFVVQFKLVKSCDVEPDLVVVQVTLVLVFLHLLTTHFLPGCLSTALFRANKFSNSSWASKWAGLQVTT